MEKIRGTVSGVIYENDDTGYRVCDVEGDNGEFFTVTGQMPPLYTGEIIEAEGTWSEHPSYGPQFKAVSIVLSLPSDTEGIRAFLASGLIPGIGPVLASKIVKKFGPATFQTVELFPERLAEVPGITAKKARAIQEAFEKHRESSDTVMFFSKFGVGTRLAMEMYRRYGESAVEHVSNDPYFAVGTVRGFAFATAERIANELGFAQDCPERLRAYVVHMLGLAAGEGHVFVPADTLFAEIKRKTGIERSEFDDELKVLSGKKKIKVEELTDSEGNTVTAVWLCYLYEAERGIEKKLRELASRHQEADQARIEKRIKRFEKESGIELDEKQKSAVASAALNGVSVITGGPGTGKTTIIKAILYVLRDMGVKTFLAAPTGRAAKRMSNACDEEAKTIHRLLEPDFSSLNLEPGEEVGDEDMKFRHNAANPLEADCIILDEVSMVDTVLMFRLLEAVRTGSRLVLVGDNDQLPSVGPGRVLRDIIASNAFETTRLDYIYRRDSDSYISYNAHLVNTGEMPEMNVRGGDFFRLNPGSQHECLENAAALVKTRLPAAYGLDPFTDIQVITPNKRGPCGSEALNQILQETLNPPHKGCEEIQVRDTVFRTGDRVMQTKNNYELEWEDYDDPSIYGAGVFNGEMGRVARIDRQEKMLYVLFDDNRYVAYDFVEMAELELCYAITVHKSQGSEFDYCVISICGVTPTLMTRNLLYTAITRAKKLCVILGTTEALAEMIGNNREIRRYTSLFKNGRFE
ncbi:MAG: ATP-dependent RecD-like DNA helicase [Clostridia bacterium]|nr:ATP-dependent RecD-like DNA helicase [Clostridia bacterium]